MGVLLAAALSGISGLYVFLALSFSLALAACASLALFLYSRPTSATVEAHPDLLRLVKRERGAVSLSVRSRAMTWCTLVSASPPKATGLSLEAGKDGDPGSFTVVASRAGRYRGVELSAAFTDALGVFERVVTVKPEGFVVEVLPLSLFSVPASTAMFAVTWGEVPGGMRGSGQEFFGVEEYKGSTESKDILWKRLSKETGERIPARVREVNIPRSVRVAIVESGVGDRALWMDAASETLGKIGRSLLNLGVGIDVSMATLDGDVSLSATSLEELAELLMEIWKQSSVPQAFSESASSSDLLLTGSEAFRSSAVFDFSDRRPTLVVPEGDALPRMGLRARLVTADPEMLNLLSSVIVR